METLGETTTAAGSATGNDLGGKDCPTTLASDLVALYVRPGSLFERLHRQNRSGAVLMLLILTHIVYGLAVVSTGVLDYDVAWRAEQQISQYVLRQEGADDEDVVTETVESFEKGAIFNQLVGRILLVIQGPIGLLLGIGILSGVLFVIVALFGSKADLQLLTGIVVFSACVDVPRLLLRLLLISQLQVMRVETSLAALAASPEVGLPVYVALRRLDPFVLWFWMLVGTGLWRARLLSGRASAVIVCILAVLAALWHGGLDVLELADISGMTVSGAGGP